MYNLLLFTHLLAVHVLVGGMLLLQTLTVRAARAAAADELVALWRRVGWLAPRVFLPGAAVTLATGLAVTRESGYRLEEPFLLAGLLVLFVGALAGPLYHAPESRRVSRLITAEGPSSPLVKSRLRRVFLIARFELGLLLLVVFCMVAKPGL
jgi:uncharacterized membrane protein